MAGVGPWHHRGRRRVPPGDDVGRLRLAQDARPLLRGAGQERARGRADRPPPAALRSAARSGAAPCSRRGRSARARMSRTPVAQQVPMQKRLFIKTYGCQMNVYDSARMADLMAPLGYTLAAS